MRSAIPRVLTILTGLMELGLGCCVALAHIARMPAVTAGRSLQAAVVIADLPPPRAGSAITIDVYDLVAASPPRQPAGVPDDHPQTRVCQRAYGRLSEIVQQRKRDKTKYGSLVGAMT